MSRQPRLSVVGATADVGNRKARKSAKAKVDITLLIRVDIAKRDWGRVHVEADRRPPFDWDRPRRWRWS